MGSKVLMACLKSPPDPPSTNSFGFCCGHHELLKNDARIAMQAMPPAAADGCHASNPLPSPLWRPHDRVAVKEFALGCKSEAEVLFTL